MDSSEIGTLNSSVPWSSAPTSCDHPHCGKTPAHGGRQDSPACCDGGCAKFTGFDQSTSSSICTRLHLLKCLTRMCSPPDGRILTKITSARKAILDRFSGTDVREYCSDFWVGKVKNTIEAWALTGGGRARSPVGGADMLRRGAVFRAKSSSEAVAGTSSKVEPLWRASRSQSHPEEH